MAAAAAAKARRVLWSFIRTKIDRQAPPVADGHCSSERIKSSKIWAARATAADERFCYAHKTRRAIIADDVRGGQRDDALRAAVLHAAARRLCARWRRRRRQRAHAAPHAIDASLVGRRRRRLRFVVGGGARRGRRGGARDWNGTLDRGGGAT